jgi:CheY-like chemotaxis protein
VVVAEPEISRVAVVDDDPSQADVMSELIRDAGYEPIIVVGPRFEHVEDLVGKVRESADAAICDHRLRTRGFALFDGAEAVAALIKVSVPSLLVTQYIEIDADVSIRRWRRRIPVLLSRDDADLDRIVQGLNECVRELRGEHLAFRRPWRTLIQVDEIDQESGEQVIDAHIPSWNPHQAVRFPAALVPPELQANLAAGVCLFAMVNIGAERAADLYFFDFEPAPEPEPEDVLLG